MNRDKTNKLLQPWVKNIDTPAMLRELHNKIQLGPEMLTVRLLTDVVLFVDEHKDLKVGRDLVYIAQTLFVLLTHFMEHQEQSHSRLSPGPIDNASLVSMLADPATIADELIQRGKKRPEAFRAMIEQVVYSLGAKWEDYDDEEATK